MACNLVNASRITLLCIGTFIWYPIGVCAVDHEFGESLLLYDKDPGVVSSWLETLDKSKSRFSTTSGGGDQRRRTVSDSDCDDVEGDIDAIESLCDTYRYAQLTNVTQQFEQLMQTNSTIDSLMTDVDTQMNGDALSIGAASGVLKTLLMQRVAIYGGVNPATNLTEMGLLKRYELLFGNTMRISSQSMASLDSLWAATQQVDNRLSNRLYNQVFQYAHMVDTLLVALQNSSAQILSSDLSDIAAMTANNNQNLTALTNAICDEQQLVQANATSAASMVSSVIPAMSSIIDNLLDQCNKLLDAFSDLDGQSTDAIKGTTDKSAQILSDGVDSLDSIAQSYVLNYAASVNKLLTVFGSELLSNHTGGVVQPLAWQIGNYSVGLTNSTTNERSKIAATQQQITDKLAAVKLDLETRIAQAQRDQLGVLSVSEDSVMSVKDTIAGNASSLADAQKQLGMSFTGAQQSLVGSMGSVIAQVKNLLDSAASSGQQKLYDLDNQVGSVQGSIGTLFNGKDTSVSAAIQSTQDSLSGGSLSSQQMVNAHLSVLSQSGALNDAQIRALSDSNSVSMQSSLVPIQNSVMSIADSAFSTVASINDARQNALSDLTGSIQASRAATAAQQASVTANTHAVFANASLASSIQADSVSLQGASSALAHAIPSVQGQSTQLANLQTSGYALEQMGTAGMANAATSLAQANSDVASQFDQKSAAIATSLKSSSDQVMSVLGNKLQSAQSDVTVPLSQLIASLQTNVSHGPSTDTTKQILSFLASISSFLDTQEAAENSTKNQFQSSLHRAALQIGSAVPAVFTATAQGTNSLQKQAKDDLVDLLGKTYGTTRIQLNQLLQANSDKTLPVKLQAKLNSMAGWASANASLATQLSTAQAMIDQVEKNADTLTASMRAQNKFDNETLISNEHQLETVIDNLGSQYVATLASSADAMGATSDQIIAHFNRYRDASLSNVSVSVASGVGNVTSPDSQLANTSSVVADVAANWTNSLQVQSSQIWANQTNSTQSVQALMDQATALGVSVNALASEPQGVGSDAAIAAATQLQAQLVNAGSLQSKEVTMLVTQSNAQSQFTTNAAAMRAGRLAQSLAVGEATGQAVGDFQSALSSVSDSLVNATDLLGDRLIGAQSDLGIMLNNVSSQVHDRDTSVRANLSVESQLQTMQLDEVRRFAKSVGGAWQDYAAYEQSKFAKMSDDDRVSLSYLTRIVDAGQSHGEDQVAGARGKLNDTDAAIDGDIAQLEQYQSDFVANSNNQTTQLAVLTNDTTSGQVILAGLLGNSSWDENAQKQIDMGRIAEFEAGLSTITSQVLD